jgi:hypothetical protein
LGHVAGWVPFVKAGAGIEFPVVVAAVVVVMVDAAFPDVVDVIFAVTVTDLVGRTILPTCVWGIIAEEFEQQLVVLPGGLQHQETPPTLSLHP